MHRATPLRSLGPSPAVGGGAPLRVGLDLVQVSRIQESLDRFGDRFLQRLFSDGEIAYARTQSAPAEHLAARFAAKEAAIKAFALSESGAGWRDIEVQRAADGAPSLALHGRAAEAAARLGVTGVALSLSHDGGYAAAVVTALCAGAPDVAAAGGTESFHRAPCSLS